MLRLVPFPQGIEDPQAERSADPLDALCLVDALYRAGCNAFDAEALLSEREQPAEVLNFRFLLAVALHREMGDADGLRLLRGPVDVGGMEEEALGIPGQHGEQTGDIMAGFSREMERHARVLPAGEEHPETHDARSAEVFIKTVALPEACASPSSTSTARFPGDTSPWPSWTISTAAGCTAGTSTPGSRALSAMSVRGRSPMRHGFPSGRRAGLRVSEAGRSVWWSRRPRVSTRASSLTFMRRRQRCSVDCATAGIFQSSCPQETPSSLPWRPVTSERSAASPTRSRQWMECSRGRSAAAWSRNARRKTQCGHSRRNTMLTCATVPPSATPRMTSRCFLWSGTPSPSIPTQTSSASPRRGDGRVSTRRTRSTRCACCRNDEPASAELLTISGTDETSRSARVTTAGMTGVCTAISLYCAVGF